MKIVLDTNVLVSGLFFRGAPSKLLDLWSKQSFEIVISEQILQEYYEVCERFKKKFSKDFYTSDFLELMSVVCEVSNEIFLKQQVSVDAKDDKFLDCAFSSLADCIVSGDKHLLDLNGYNGIEILKPREFLDKYF